MNDAILNEGVTCFIVGGSDELKKRFTLAHDQKYNKNIVAMKLHTEIPSIIKEKIMNHADELCKTFDSTANCKSFLEEKLTLPNSTVHYFENMNGDITGICILEIIDQYYGNLIVHTIDENDEAPFANLLTTNQIINKNILELIQFRSNFNYRDEFLRLGLREKERIRMWHKNIQTFFEIPSLPHVKFKQLTLQDSPICGEISFRAHKHRINIESYDVYSTKEKRALFADDFRNNKHGPAITEGCLLMSFKDTPIGLIEAVDTRQGEVNIAWIMDIALLPEYQGIGYGKHLIKKSLSEIYKSGYTTAGLAVTLTNKNAHQLYESLGFEDYEFFVEIIGG